MPTRPPAVAGQFYPAEPALLQQQVESLLQQAEANSAVQQAEQSDAPIRALIAPHAGFIYSGPVAASAYAPLRRQAGRIHRVFLLGPSHRVPFKGLATPEADYYQTPLGDIELDTGSLRAAERHPGVSRLDAAHRWEHSLEVQLPFLQAVLGDFRLIPLVVGQADMTDTAALIQDLSGAPDVLTVVSTDLSHYHSYDQAMRRDAATASAIEALDATALDGDGACGYHPLQGLLLAAKEKGWRIRRLDLRNSGDTAGSRDRVVGYGAWILFDNGEHAT